MKDIEKYTVSDELLTAYIEGRATPEEMMLVVEALKCDESLRETLAILENLDQEASTGRFLPMEHLAAASQDNLCDVICEQRILAQYGLFVSQETDEDQDANRWIRENGTPLYNIGRLLELAGMSITRKYDSTLQDISDAISKGNKVITVVDYALLLGGETGGLFHAMICLSVSQHLVLLFDPATGKNTEFDAQTFAEAWAATRNYMVCASPEGLEYEPYPIDLSDVQLDDNLLELSEAIAENAHEVWALERKKEGWKYGCKRDDDALTSPDMVPYSDLPESEKEYDRKLAFDTLRLAKKLGFKVEKPTTRKCPHCGAAIQDFAHFCPMCGKPLSWKDFE